MGLGSRDRYPQYLATSMVWRLVPPPHERRHHPLPVVPPLPDDDDTIELLSLGLVHGYDLHARRIVDAPKNLVLSERCVQDFSSSGVLPITHPHSRCQCAPSVIRQSAPGHDGKTRSRYLHDDQCVQSISTASLLGRHETRGGRWHAMESV